MAKKLSEDEQRKKLCEAGRRLKESHAGKVREAVGDSSANQEGQTQAMWAKDPEGTGKKSRSSRKLIHKR